MTPDERPRSEQVRSQRGEFNPADLDNDGVFNTDKWLARLAVKHAGWERRNAWRKDWR